MKAFLAQRPHDINLNTGVAGKPGVLTFHMFDDTSGINTFDPERAKMIEANGRFRVQKKIEVPVMTVPQILARHWPSGFPDFMSVDVEGLDLEILQSIDFAGPTPKLICAEANSRQHGRATAEFLESVGYTLYFRASVNMFFLRSDLLPALRP
jgi:FkbM family methyltransferase